MCAQSSVCWREAWFHLSCVPNPMPHQDFLANSQKILKFTERFKFDSELCVCVYQRSSIFPARRAGRFCQTRKRACHDFFLSRRKKQYFLFAMQACWRLCGFSCRCCGCCDCCDDDVDLDSPVIEIRIVGGEPHVRYLDDRSSPEERPICTLGGLSSCPNVERPPRPNLLQMSARRRRMQPEDIGPCHKYARF